VHDVRRSSGAGARPAADLGRGNPEAGVVHSVLQVVKHPQLNHQMQVEGGVLAGRSGQMLQAFFEVAASCASISLTSMFGVAGAAISST